MKVSQITTSTASMTPTIKVGGFILPPWRKKTSTALRKSFLFLGFLGGGVWKKLWGSDGGKGKNTHTAVLQAIRTYVVEGGELEKKILF